MYKIIGANQVEYGPVTAEQVRQWIVEGRVNAQTQAQAVGDPNWKAISAFPDFAASFPSNATPPPFSAAPPIPPVTPPPMGSPFPSDAGRAGALREVNGPAIGLIITAILSALGAVSSLGWNAMGMSANLNQFQNFPAQNQHFMEMMMHYSLFSSVVAIALAVLIFIAGLKMKNLQSHTLCIIASILAIIPCTTGCCCVGIPIGIWALIVLCKPEVRDYFS